jgi:hypothetical protein
MKLFALHTLALVSMIAAVGCSSPASPSPTNSAEIAGSVNNVSLKARSAIARYGTAATTVNGTTTSVRELTIMISDKANTCSAFHAQDSINLFLTITKDNAGPGNYPIANTAVTAASGDQSEVDFNAVDHNCKDKVAQPATTGAVNIKNVTVSVVGPGHSIVSGTIDATFSGGHVTGDFDAVLCPDAAAADASSTGGDARSPSAQTCTP